ncbi:MAG: beta-lactamase family protein [Candidatus Eisenbacteria bacterium]|nr:beta-lactamase family protein [Candidatus Eisenbacteria bacterium]
MIVVGFSACSDDGPPTDPDPTPTLEQRLQTILDESVRTDQLTGAMLTVVQPGTVDWSGASGLSRRPDVALRPEESFRCGSVTKLLAAVIALQLVEEEDLSLDQTLDGLLRVSLVDSLPAGETITIRMLLNHTSGLADYAENPALGQAILADPDRKWTPEELIGLALALEPAGTPGQRWSYASTNYVLLELVLEAVSGKPFDRLLAERIIVPLGLTHTRLPSNSAIDGAHGYQDVEGDEALEDMTFLDPSYLRAAGGVVSTTRELTLVSRALWRYELLSSSSVQAMQQTVPTEQPFATYGLGLTVLFGSYYGHAGIVPGYTSGLFYWPEEDVTVALAINQGGRESAGLALLLRVMSLFVTADVQPTSSSDVPGPGWSFGSGSQVAFRPR